MQQEKIIGSEIEEFEIPGLGRIGATPEIVFKNGLALLKRHRLSLIGLRDLAYLRMNANREGDFLSRGVYVRDSVLFNSGNFPLFISGSILLSNRKMLDGAVSAQQKQKEFIVSGAIFEHFCKLVKSNKNVPPEERAVYLFDEEEQKKLEKFRQKNNYFVPTNKLREFGLTRWAYKELAREYGNMLNNLGIEKMPVWFPEDEYVSEIKSPFLRQVWVCCLKGHKGTKGESGLSANNRSLHETSRLVGISKSYN